MLVSYDVSLERHLSRVRVDSRRVVLRSCKAEKSVLHSAFYALRIRESRVGEVRHGFD